MVIKQEDISEVFAHIHIKDNEVTFDNFTVQNLLYEIPVTRFLEPLFHYKLDDLVERVIYYNHKIIFMHKNSCSVFDFQKINIDKIDLSELFKESYKFVVSENLQWIVYCDDYINIAKLEAGHYIKKKESTICYLKNIRDFSFVENDLLMLSDTELLIYDMETDTCKEKYNIKKENYVLGRFNKISYSSLQCGLVILENQHGKKMYYNLNNRKGIKEGYGEKSNFISSLDTESLYRVNYNGLIKEKLEDSSCEIVYDKWKRQTTDVGNEKLGKIKAILYDYYFCLDDSEKRWNRKKVVKVYKILNEKFIQICEISERESIVDFWIFSKGLLTLDEENNLRWWKISS